MNVTSHFRGFRILETMALQDAMVIAVAFACVAFLVAVAGLYDPVIVVGMVAGTVLGVVLWEDVQKDLGGIQARNMMVIHDEYKHQGDPYVQVAFEWSVAPIPHGAPRTWIRAIGEKYPNPTLAADWILIMLDAHGQANNGWVLMIKRAQKDPNQPDGNANKWALPGGCVPYKGRVKNQAKTELWEETGVTPPTEESQPAELQGVYDHPMRDPFRKHFISIMYRQTVTFDPKAKTLPEDTPCAHEITGKQFLPLKIVMEMIREDIEDSSGNIAFDHALALVDAVFGNENVGALPGHLELLEVLGGHQNIQMLRNKWK